MHKQNIRYVELKHHIMTNWKKEHRDDSTHSSDAVFLTKFLSLVGVLNSVHHMHLKQNNKEREMKGKEELKLEGRGRTSNYLEVLSCNLLEGRQERYKQKSPTDSFWLRGEWNISYLVAK